MNLNTSNNLYTLENIFGGRLMRRLRNKYPLNTHIVKYAVTFVSIFLSLFFYQIPVKAQSVLDKINKLEKAVFTISSHTKDGATTKITSGFFISPDGIAIVPSDVLLNSDSISIFLRNGRKYSLERVLSTHKMANLSMIKAYDQRAKGFDYIVPSQQTDRSLNEVLIISNPDETEEGVTLGQILKVNQAPYLDRVVTLNANFKSRSAGSPVIDNQGELVGIAGFLPKGGITYYYSTHILNDTLWINHPYNKWKNSLYQSHKAALYPYFNDGIINYINDMWVESAKNFTIYIKNDTANIEAHLLRGEARRQYENFIGMRDDFSYVLSKTNGHFLIDYFDARNLLKKQQKNDAFLKYITSIEKNDHFAPSLIEFGLLAVELRNDVETAMKCFNKAIECAPLFADGYYERSRLLQQYLNNNELATEDINKAISLNNRLPGAFSIRGTLKIQSEDYLEAISDFDRALSIDAHDTHALFNRGLAYFNLGMKEKSCKDWDAAGQLGHYKAIRYISRYCNKITTKRVGN